MCNLASKSELLSAFEAQLKSTYPWARDEAKLGRFMSAARGMLNAEPMCVGIDREGPIWRASLRSVGLPERLALYRLQELDD